VVAHTKGHLNKKPGHNGPVYLSMVDVTEIEVTMLITQNRYFNNTVRNKSNYHMCLTCQDFGAGCSGQVDPTGVDYDHNSSIPEPTTLALMGFGLAGIGWMRRKAA